MFASKHYMENMCTERSFVVLRTKGKKHIKPNSSLCFRDCLFGRGTATKQLKQSIIKETAK